MSSAKAGFDPGASELEKLGSLRTITLLTLAAITALIVYPLGVMIWIEFGPSSAVRSHGLVQALSQAGIWNVLDNTVYVVVASAALAMVFGTLFAWLNERTDADAGRFGQILPLLPLLLPQIAGAIGWVMLLAPRAGLLNVLLRKLFAALGMSIQDGPLNIYTMSGLIAVTALYLTPYVYLPVAAALKSLDPSLEEASRMAKASSFTTFCRVTMPAIRPSLFSAALLALMMGFAMFAVPVIIGKGANIELLPVLIFQLVYSYPPHVDLAILVGLFLTGVVSVLLCLQTVLAPTELSAQIGGKSSRAARVKLGVWRWPARSVLILFIVVSGILPVIGLAFVSLQPFWTANVNLSVLGLQNYWAIFRAGSESGQAMVNSMVLGAIGGTVGMLIAALLTLGMGRAGGRLRTIINTVTAAPAGIPHVVLAVGFILCFSSGWFNMSGTWLILFLAYIVLFLPQAMRSATAAYSQVGRELIDAAAIFKAGHGRTFATVILPLMLPGLVAGWVIQFVQMTGELTASALLAKSTNPVVGQVLLDLWQNGSFPEIAALALLITAVNVLVVSLVFGLSRRIRGAA